MAHPLDPKPGANGARFDRTLVIQLVMCGKYVVLASAAFDERHDSPLERIGQYARQTNLGSPKIRGMKNECTAWLENPEHLAQDSIGVREVFDHHIGGDQIKRQFTKTDLGCKGARVQGAWVPLEARKIRIDAENPRDARYRFRPTAVQIRPKPLHKKFFSASDVQYSDLWPYKEFNTFEISLLR